MLSRARAYVVDTGHRGGRQRGRDLLDRLSAAPAGTGPLGRAAGDQRRPRRS